MKMYYRQNPDRTPNTALCGWIARAATLSVVISLAGAVSTHLIDGVTAATNPAGPRPPSLRIQTPDGAPPLAQGTVRVQEGQTVMLDFKVWDAQDAAGKYRDFALVPAPADWPSGAQFSFDRNSGVGHYRWATGAGDSARYPETTLTFSASNTALGGTTKEKVALVFGGAAPPGFIGTLPEHQEATAGVRFRFPVTVAPSREAVRITARGLPRGARLGTARRDRRSGNWVAQMNWKPDSRQAGQSFDVTFIASKKIRRERLQAQAAVRFTVR